MKSIKILLSDPRHSTVGSLSNFIPINIGYIASYIKNELKDFDVKINLTTEMKWNLFMQMIKKELLTDI